MAMRLGAVPFLVPFIFVFNPSLVLVGGLGHIVISMFSSLLGVVLLASGIEGYLLKIGKIGWAVRILLIIAAVALFYLPLRIGG